MFITLNGEKGNLVKGIIDGCLSGKVKNQSERKEEEWRIKIKLKNTTSVRKNSELGKVPSSSFGMARRVNVWDVQVPVGVSFKLQTFGALALLLHHFSMRFVRIM